MSTTEDLPQPIHPTDEAECPACASALFPVPAPGPAGWRWSHHGLEFEPCPNDEEN